MNPYLQGGELGDFICTEGDCKIGRALVQQMLTVYAGAVAQLAANPSAQQSFQSKYATSVQGLADAADSADGIFTRWVPFAPGCCTIKQVGFQAQEITHAMQVDAGLAVTSGVDPGSGTSLDSIVTMLKWLAFTATTVAIIAGGYLVVKTGGELVRSR